jgi:hypothetical protein
LIIGWIAKARGSNQQAQAAAERAAREESKPDIAQTLGNVRL